VNSQQKTYGLASRLRSYLFYTPVIWAYTVFMGTLSLLSSFIDRNGRVQQWFAVTWSKMILNTISVDVRVHGMERIDTTRPHMYALNHLSALDIPVVYVMMPIHFRIMAKKELFRYPFMGWHLRRSGQVPIERENAISSMRSLNKAAASLKEGMPLVVFPEGGRSANGQLQPFLPGVFYVAIKSGVDVVPVAMVGTYEMLPMDTFHIMPRPVDVLVGEPISSAGYTVREMDKLAAKVEKAVADLYYSRSDVKRPEASAGGESLDVPRLSQQGRD
jgi:1-acyl-sn-glycerol-3-phosphate acyltransferase